MSWYCAHAIFYFELRDEPQDSYLIWENVYLVEASSDEEALSKAEKYAKTEEASGSDTLTLNDKPCRYKLAGIRKLITVSYIEEAVDKPNDVPVSGAEVTYSELEVDTLDEVMKLAKGEMVEVLYRE
jgi:hypothetical protein